MSLIKTKGIENTLPENNRLYLPYDLKDSVIDIRKVTSIYYFSSNFHLLNIIYS